MRRHRILLTTAALAAALVGCAGADTETPAAAEPTASAAEPGTPADDAVPAGDTDLAAAPEPDGEPLAHLTSCDSVAAAVAPYVEGLVPTPSSTVDEWGVTCGWEIPESETELAAIRSVDVSAVALEPGAVAPDVAGMRELMDDIVGLEDPWLEERGGVAYTMSLDTAVAGVIVTTVWLPEVEMTISGGRWADHPALDGPAALEVAKQLLG